ncbi:MAG: isoprenylcysteine carboxylmethyltransferase family protein [Gammaproteobacteria bacterium]|nr:isoprenylcysteine carboxylmethyltransferase family protein [Gammaproteobacteria bacterium]
MSKSAHAENRDSGRAGEARGSRSAVIAFVATALVLHGIFTVALPALILGRTEGVAMLHPDIGLARWLGAGLAGFGIYLYLWSAVQLLRRRTSAVPGKTAAALLTHGWYGRTRHPLLLGVVAILFGETVFFSSLALLGYALAYWLWLTVFVTVREEPDLRRTFGADYDAYCREVPRWIPRGGARPASASSPT